MKILKLVLYQQTACYKKPFAFKVSETYPLPPYSTVKGMLHSILGAENFIPMKISIQGDYESIINNYQNMYFYKSKEITSMPLNIHLLYNVKIIVHVHAEERVLYDILDILGTKCGFLSLGRWEDVVRIDDAKFIEVEEVDFEEDEVKEYKLKMPAYIPKKCIPCELKGISYRLNWRYELIQNVRQWEKVDVLYVDSGEIINDGIVMIDSEHDVVFFN